MMQNKKIVGITGGSGCGKSYISDLLRSRGIPVIDADTVAHEVMEKGSPCLLELSEFFGKDILSGGELDRKKLGQIVFSDSKKLEMLNKISHKYVLSRIYNIVETLSAPIICVDGAVLIESGFKASMMIGVLADYETRKKRIMMRDNLTEAAAKARLDAQKSDDFYKEHCDFIIENNGGEIDINYIIKRITT